MGQHFTIPKDLRDHADVKAVVARWVITPRELDKLYTKFRIYDINNDGTLEFEEFFKFVLEPQYRLFDTIVELIVPRIPGSHLTQPISFTVWLVTVFSFSFMTHEELANQVYRAYDSRRRGRLSMHDLHNLLISIHGDNSFFPKDAVQALTEVSLSKGGNINFEDFATANLKFPMLLWPVYRMQEDMRREILGPLFETLDKRSGDIYHQTPLAHTLKVKWRKRRARMWVCCLGWPCCLKVPMQGVKLEARTADEAMMHLANQGENLGEKDATEAARQLKALMDVVCDSEPSSDNSFTDVEMDEYTEAQLW